MSALLKCDFCYVSVRVDLVWTYEWPPTTVPANNGSKAMDDDGLWAACHDCHLLIDNQDIDGLMERSMRGDTVSQKVPQAAAWKRFLFEWMLAMPLLNGPYQGPPRAAPIDGQHR